MSKIVAGAAIRGGRKIVGEAEEFLNRAIKEKGKDQKVEFPETGFFLPMAYALLGIEVRTLGDMIPVLKEAKSLLREEPSKSLWLPYLGDALDSGIATLFGEEIIVALRYLYGKEPQPDCVGFYTDTWMRSYGIQLVDGRMPGFAAILGAAPDNKMAVEIVRELQKRNIICFVGSNHNGRSIIDQLKEENVQMGWETYIVPYGRDTITGIYPLNWAIRAALTFGGHKKGEALKCLKYCQNRVFAFGLTLGELDDVKYATGAGAMNMGFPVIADTDIPEIRPSGICTYEHLVKELDHKKLIPTSIQVRGVKVRVTEIPIPVAYSAAFEGETVRKEQMYVQFGGKYSKAFEYVTTRDLDKVEDGKIELIGPEIDKAQEGSAMPLGIYVEVAGRKMQKDFEPILERQIHTFLNEAMGIFHMGQRDLNWLRISKDAKKKGFKIHHFGVIIHARLHDTFGAIVDKAQVTIYTRQEDVEKYISQAKKVYEERDERMAGMTDESVDTLYSCSLCQSFAPNHVCIVKPERLGLCGAYTWLDARACYELNPTGPNQPVKKGECLDPVRGEWKGVNDFIYQKSNKTLERFHGYSIITFPETSCCVGNTEVIIDRQVVKVGEFINKHQGREEYTKSSVLTLRNGKTVPEKIVAIQKFPAPKNLIKLTTKSGAEIILTREHKIAIDRSEGLSWVMSEKVVPGDRTISFRKLELPSQTPEIINLIPDDFWVRDEALITLIKHKLKAKYGSLSSAWKKLNWGRYNPRLKGFTLKSLKLIVEDLGEDWEEVKKSVRKIARAASVVNLPEALSPELFYLAGLITSDGSISRWGKYEYWIDFINTNEELISVYTNTYRQIFPEKSINVRLKGKSKGEIRGRKINSTKTCFLCHTNNPLLGVILNYFGIKVGAKGKWNLSKLLSLPQNFIVSYLAGIFDGDGSVRLRKYRNKWDIGEAYLCIEEKRAAFHLQLLLKRLGVIGNLRKAGSVYKIELHGTNLVKFAEQIPVKHPRKREILEDIRFLSSENKINKSQEQVLPFSFGKAIAELPESRKILSPTTHFYYETARSRPVMANVAKVIDALPQEKQDMFKTLMETDYFLDIVTKVEKIQNKNQYKYVYNLTTSDEHCYFANAILIKNCGCFECIIAILPEMNGFMIVNREFAGMTPIGMTFSTLAGSVGGGTQTPGFMGIGRLYIVSRKFISADGGIRRIVWMTKGLKEALGEKFKKRCEEEGVPDLIDKIGDEEVATTTEELFSFLQKVKHPALEMEPLV
ncbi:MAG: LAGLIDADG family homing endonuclease [bacterium]